MTDAQLRDAAVAKLKQTTVGYVNKHWSTPPDGSFWKDGLDVLAQIGAPSPPPPPPPPPGNVVFEVDYDTDDFSVWDGGVAMLAASKSLVPDPAGSGVRVARLQVGSSSGQAYCEPVRLRNNGLAIGLTVLVEQELFVQAGSVWADARSWNNLGQTKIQSPDLYGGGLCVDPLSFVDGPHFVYRIRATGSNGDPDMARVDCGPVTVSRWIKFAWLAKWSAGPDGFLHVTRDGAAMSPYSGPTTTDVGSPSGQDGKGVWRKLTQGLYCGPSLPSPQTVYYKGLKVTG